MGTRITVRQAAQTDVAALAELRWRWVAEEGDDAGAERAAFLTRFSSWAVDHLSTHLAFVVETDGQPVGMAWLMVADRVPSPARHQRRFGDVQSVYVVPELRNSGAGAVLLDAVLAEARRLELEHVTVHSSERAVPFYERVGFRHDERWLRWQPE